MMVRFLLAGLFFVSLSEARARECVLNTDGAAIYKSIAVKNCKQSAHFCASALTSKDYRFTDELAAVNCVGGACMMEGQTFSVSVYFRADDSLMAVVRDRFTNVVLANCD